jgi:hypothetical protein
VFYAAIHFHPSLIPAGKTLTPGVDFLNTLYALLRHRKISWCILQKLRDSMHSMNNGAPYFAQAVSYMPFLNQPQVGSDHTCKYLKINSKIKNGTTYLS